MQNHRKVVDKIELGPFRVRLTRDGSIAVDQGAHGIADWDERLEMPPDLARRLAAALTTLSTRAARR